MQASFYKDLLYIESRKGRRERRERHLYNHTERKPEVISDTSPTKPGSDHGGKRQLSMSQGY
jgi:hypothetical protein